MKENMGASCEEEGGDDKNIGTGCEEGGDDENNGDCLAGILLDSSASS